MAINPLGTSDQGTVGYTDTLVWSHTTGVGSNLLLVGLTDYVGSAILSMTFNSIPLTLYRTYIGPSSDSRVHLYYLTNPDIGTFDIEVIQDIAVSMACVAIDFSGVDIADIFDIY